MKMFRVGYMSREEKFRNPIPVGRTDDVGSLVLGAQKQSYSVRRSRTECVWSFPRLALGLSFYGMWHYCLVGGGGHQSCLWSAEEGRHSPTAVSKAVRQGGG